MVRTEPVKYYEEMKFEFTENDGSVLQGNRTFIPVKLRQKVLNIVHEGYLGITKMKSLMREKVYWQGMKKEEENFINEYTACQVNTKI